MVQSDTIAESGCGLRSGKNALQVGEHGLHHGGDGTCPVVLGSLDGFAGHESQLLKTCSVHFERRNQCGNTPTCVGKTVPQSASPARG